MRPRRVSCWLISGVGSLASLPPNDFLCPRVIQAEEELQRQVRRLLDEHQFSKADCLLAVGRSAVELKYMSLPPVPDDELPELVRFQAIKEFATIGEDWPIDYLPLDSDPAKPRHVMAATLNPQFVGRFREVCTELNITLRSIVLRPCGMASLVCRQFTLADNEGSLLIDPLDRQMDLAVLLGKSLVFLRSARSEPGTWSDESLSAATMEVRRTIAAASSRLAGNKFTAIYVCGSGPAHRTFAERLESETGTTTYLFDPFGELKATDELIDVPEDERSRYAPLVGMLLDAAEEKSHALDFLRPRRKQEPPSRRREYTLAGAAAAAIFLVVGGWFWLQLHALNAELEQLTDASKELDNLVKRGQDLDKKIGEIDKWSATDVTWIDELATLSEKLPPAEQLLLYQLRASAKVGGGEWQLDGVVKDVATLKNIEGNMNDPRHDVEHKSSQQRVGETKYPWQFKSSVLVKNDADVPAPKTPAKRPTAGANLRAVKP